MSLNSPRLPERPAPAEPPRRATVHRISVRFAPPSAGLLLLACAACLSISAAGCGREPTQFVVTSYLQPATPEVFTEQFPDGTFKVDSLRNYQIAFEVPPTVVRVPRSKTIGAADPQTQPVEDDLADEVWMSQIVLIDLMWRPLPGKTFAESSQSNASIVYCLITGENVISYEGSGFVFFTESDDGAAIEGQLESATLYPVRFVGSPADLFGPCRVQGTFTAQRSGTATTDLQRRVRRLLANPSRLDSK